MAVFISGLVAALSGCPLSPLATRTAAFSTAATATIAQTNNAYQLVNQTFFDEQMAVLVANYDKTGFDPASFQPFIHPDDLAVRTKVLNGIEQYATLLAEVSGNQPITDLETQATAAGQALTKLQQSDFKGFKIDSSDQNLAVTAVVAIGAVLINHERNRALPGILDKMNQPIQDICKVLEDDIGTDASPGLADALHRAYSREIQAEVDFIKANAGSMDADQRRTEIETLPKLVQAQQQADQALAATVKSLKALAAAHAALTTTKAQKNAPAFRLELTQLVQDAQSINGFYTSLSSTK